MRLTRCNKTDRATYGVMATDDGSAQWFTLERPWLDNAPGVSCIPVGEYPCRRRWSNHLNMEVIGVYDVPDRSEIEIHPANYVTQLAGCIAPGTAVFDIDGDGVDDVQHSRQAFGEIMAAVGTEPFTLTVTDPA